MVIEASAKVSVLKVEIDRLILKNAANAAFFVFDLNFIL
jgi:hypothetical protein